MQDYNVTGVMLKQIKLNRWSKKVKLPAHQRLLLKTVEILVFLESQENEPVLED